MAILNENDLIAALANCQVFDYEKVNQTAEGAGTYHSLWRANGLPISGAIPASGNGAIPDRTTLGAIPFVNPTGGNTSYLVGMDAVCNVQNTLILYDRLFHNSGLVGNVVTAQTFTQPALTRFTDGVGVEIFIEFYTSIGATACTFNVAYTDADNVARVGTYAHPANAESVGQMVKVVPSAGARGCKSVQSVTLSATSGTAGNFGITLAKRIATIAMPLINVANERNAIDTRLAIIPDDACLALAVLCTGTATGNHNGQICIGQK